MAPKSIIVFLLLSQLCFSQEKMGKTPTSGEQFVLCEKFRDDNFSGLIDKARQYGYELYEIYDCITCDGAWRTNADLIKYRASLPTARSDIMSLARYYIKIHNDPEALTRIFNTVVDNPGQPRGTLLDWVDFYRANPNLRPEQKEEMKAYEEVIRHFGGKREAELTAEERQNYQKRNCKEQ
jgi:hypothetical protein